MTTYCGRVENMQGCGVTGYQCEQCREIDRLVTELKGAKLVASSAKTALAAKDEAYALQSRQWNELQEKARTADGEREANAILTDENDKLRDELAEAKAERDHALRRCELLHDGLATETARADDFTHGYVELRAGIALCLYFGRLSGAKAQRVPDDAAVHASYECPHCGAVGSHEQDSCHLIAAAKEGK